MKRQFILSKEDEIIVDIPIDGYKSSISLYKYFNSISFQFFDHIKDYLTNIRYNIKVVNNTTNKEIDQEIDSNPDYDIYEYDIHPFNNYSIQCKIYRKDHLYRKPEELILIPECRVINLELEPINGWLNSNKKLILNNIKINDYRIILENNDGEKGFRIEVKKIGPNICQVFLIYSDTWEPLEAFNNGIQIYDTTNKGYLERDDKTPFLLSTEYSYKIYKDEQILTELESIKGWLY